MFPQGPWARQKVEMAGPFTVARRDMLISVAGFDGPVVIPVGYQIPDWKKLGFTERQVKNLFALGFLEQAPGKPWAIPSPSSAQRSTQASRTPRGGTGAGTR